MEKFNKETGLPELTGNFVDDGYSLAKAIAGEGRDMLNLSVAFRMTGNQAMADELKETANVFEDLSELIRGLIKNEVNRGFKQSQDSLNEVIGMVLKKELQIK